LENTDNMEIEVFEGIDDSEMEIPKQEDNKDNIANKLMTVGIEEALVGDEVKSVLIPDDKSVIKPNYVINISNIKTVEHAQITALDSLLHVDGNVAIYLYMNNKMQKVGMAYSNIVDRLIVVAVNNIFNNDCEIYKDVEVGKKVKMINSKDISYLRLSI